jgi:hypothetical protein
MRNVTLTLDEAVAAWARVRAAQLDMSLSAYLAALLRAQMEQSAAYEQARQGFLAERPVALKRGGRYPQRTSLHERSRLR